MESTAENLPMDNAISIIRSISRAMEVLAINRCRDSIIRITIKNILRAETKIICLLTNVNQSMATKMAKPLLDSTRMSSVNYVEITTMVWIVASEVFKLVKRSITSS